VNLDATTTQAEFASLVGLSEARVSQLVAAGVIERGMPLRAWLLAYIDHLREIAAGRQSGELGGLDLVQERAALAREQRRSYEIKNAVAEGTYAPIGLLAQVLAMASQAVSDRLDALPGVLRKTCPALDDTALAQLGSVIASARNEWARGTERLVVEALGADPEELDDESEGHQQ
jgi:phage terminase Nu1 subunit (DNA packaging protein)